MINSASAPPRCSPASGAGGCLREGVARRPWMAGGMGTDGSRLTDTLCLSNQQAGSQSVTIVGLKNPRRSIKESETPHRRAGICAFP